MDNNDNEMDILYMLFYDGKISEAQKSAIIGAFKASRIRNAEYSRKKEQL